jgi:hypothetical protein
VIASQAHHASIPGSSFGIREQKPDRLSSATYNQLPERYQKIARDLQRKGEIIIGE